MSTWESNLRCGETQVCSCTSMEGGFFIFLIKNLIKNVSRIPAALADQPGKKMTAKIVGAAVDSEVKKIHLKIIIEKYFTRLPL